MNVYLQMDAQLRLQIGVSTTVFAWQIASRATELSSWTKLSLLMLQNPQVSAIVNRKWRASVGI